MAVIDLYSGIGGWTLGFKMAGIEVLSSYEWWKDANNTHNKNFGSDHAERNIRTLTNADLPDPALIDFVVGSPPCTQFSLANRGGKGNIADGLVDIQKFLEIVEYLNPIYWAMENVPRVAGILEREIAPEGSLARFRYLFDDIRIYKASDFGVPQDRKRMIAGRFPFDLFESYKNKTSVVTLGDVLSSLEQNPIHDPVYNITLDKKVITDHVFEPNLSHEEERINRETKTHNPVYNAMSFPDRLDRPSRTVTALCTRVSRESIIVRDVHDNIRRLTVRERGCLQSFPITYQYFSKSYAGKIKMIGNAVPPVLTFFIAQSMLQVPLPKLVLPNEVPNDRLELGNEVSVSSKPDNQGKSYSWSRSFWLAIQGLRFGSGVRFELKNIIDKSRQTVNWKINFFYGNSKAIKNWSLTEDLLRRALAEVKSWENSELEILLKEYEQFISRLAVEDLQKNWINKDRTVYGPISLIDDLSDFVQKMKVVLKLHSKDLHQLQSFIINELTTKEAAFENKKILENGLDIFIGILIGSIFNTYISKSNTSVERHQVNMDLAC